MLETSTEQLACYFFSKLLTSFPFSQAFFFFSFSLAWYNFNLYFNFWDTTLSLDCAFFYIQQQAFSSSALLSLSSVIFNRPGVAGAVL